MLEVLQPYDSIYPESLAISTSGAFPPPLLGTDAVPQGKELRMRHNRGMPLSMSRNPGDQPRSRSAADSQVTSCEPSLHPKSYSLNESSTRQEVALEPTLVGSKRRDRTPPRLSEEPQTTSEVRNTNNASPKAMALQKLPPRNLKPRS